MTPVREFDDGIKFLPLKEENWEESVLNRFIRSTGENTWLELFRIAKDVYC